MPDDPLTDDLSSSAIDEIFKNNDAERADAFKNMEAAVEGGAGGGAGQPAAASLPAPAAATLVPPVPAGKLPGPETLKSQAPVPAPAPAPEPFADIPREYKPGKGGAENWTKLHQKADAFQTKAAALEAELSKLKLAGNGQASPDLQKQLDALLGERDHYRNQLEAVAVERSPRFEAAFKPRIEAAMSQAKQAVGAEKSALIESLLQLPESRYRDEQLESILEGIGGMRQGKLHLAIAEMDRIRSEREYMSKNGQEVYKRWATDEQARQAQQKQQHVQQVASVLDAELSDWQRSVDLFKPKDGDAEHNSRVQSRVETAKAIFSGGLDLPSLARAAAWASIGPDLVQASQADKKLIAELQADLAALRGAQPGHASDSGPAGGSGDDSSAPSNLSYADSIAQAVLAAGHLRH